jgi:hypothetical protein
MIYANVVKCAVKSRNIKNVQRILLEKLKTHNTYIEMRG